MSSSSSRPCCCGAITSANSTTVSAIFLKTEVTFLKDSSDNSSWTFSLIFSVHAVIAGAVLCIFLPLNSKRSRYGLVKIRVPESALVTSGFAALRLAPALLPLVFGCSGIAVSTATMVENVSTMAMKWSTMAEEVKSTVAVWRRW
nr:hypothetical protein Iba_chr03aCG4740 [Ipomoea batatas]